MSGIEGQPAKESGQHTEIVITVIIVLVIIYILVSSCNCGSNMKSRMFDPVIYNLPIPGSFNPNSPNNQLHIGDDENYNGYLGTNYGSV